MRPVFGGGAAEIFLGQWVHAEAGDKLGALAADVFGSSAGFACGFEGGGKPAEFAETRPVGFAESAPRVGGEREIGVPEGGERGEKDEIAERSAVAHDALLHEAFEAEGVSIAAGGVEGVAGLQEANQPSGVGGGTRVRFVSVCDWGRGHGWVVDCGRNGRGEKWRWSI